MIIAMYFINRKTQVRYYPTWETRTINLQFHLGCIMMDIVLYKLFGLMLYVICKYLFHFVLHPHLFFQMKILVFLLHCYNIHLNKMLYLHLYRYICCHLLEILYLHNFDKYCFHYHCSLLTVQLFCFFLVFCNLLC